LREKGGGLDFRREKLREKGGGLEQGCHRGGLLKEQIARREKKPAIHSILEFDQGEEKWQSNPRASICNPREFYFVILDHNKLGLMIMVGLLSDRKARRYSLRAESVLRVRNQGMVERSDFKHQFCFFHLLYSFINPKCIIGPRDVPRIFSMRLV
jgi:hypothetical protein